MKRTLSKKSIILIRALAMLVAVLLNNAVTTRRPSLIQRSAVISGEYAAVRVMPSRFTASIGVCLHGQRITVRMPSIFDFYRARCNGTDGFISRARITVADHERAN